MPSEIELPPVLGARGRKTTLRLSALAAAAVVALAAGLGIRQAAQNAAALERFPDRVEVFSATWAPGMTGVAQIGLCLTRKDGLTFDPRSGVTLTDPGPGGGRLHYVRGWSDPRAGTPTRQVTMDFRQAVRLPPGEKGPIRIEIDGWTQPRLPDPWLLGIRRLMGIRPPARLMVPLYPLEGGATLLPPPKRSRAARAAR